MRQRSAESDRGDDKVAKKDKADDDHDSKNDAGVIIMNYAGVTIMIMIAMTMRGGWVGGGGGVGGEGGGGRALSRPASSARE